MNISDIDAALNAGAIDQATAERLRAFSTQPSDPEAAQPSAEDEAIRLVTGFNDIFVTLAILLVLVPAGLIVGGIAVAALSWGLAEIFTRKRRMALPSIVLSLFFGISVTTACARIIVGPAHPYTGILLVVAPLVGAAAAYGHWRRFLVPIDIACIAGAVSAAILVVLTQILFGPSANPGDVIRTLPLLILACGLGCFAIAMVWDRRDPERLTISADVAFWLHLLSAPLIVHPIFMMLGMLGTRDPGFTHYAEPHLHGGASPGTAVAAVLVYAILGTIAVIIDRRALLVSGIGYLLAAMAVLLRTTGSIQTVTGYSAILIGILLLTLSVWWNPLRRRIADVLPDSWRVQFAPLRG